MKSLRRADAFRAHPRPQPTKADLPREPQRSDNRFKVKLGLLDRIRNRQEALEAEAQQRFEELHARWEEVCAAIETDYDNEVAEWEREVAGLKARHETSMEAWEKERESFLAARDASNGAIDAQKADYLTGSDPQAIIDYCDMVPARSQYPDYFPQSYELDYNPNNQLLLVDY